MLIKWGNGLFMAGRDYVRFVDFRIGIFWNPKDDPKPGELMYRDGFEIYFNWLPRFEFMPPSWLNVSGYQHAAVLWTGRRRELLSWNWVFGIWRTRERPMPEDFKITDLRMGAGVGAMTPDRIKEIGGG